MTNILIIGTGVHAIRYIETFIFKKELNVEIYEYNNKSLEIASKYGINTVKKLSDLQKYHIIFLDVPLEVRNAYIEEIADKYSNILLIEKPLALYTEEAKHIKEKCKNIKLAVIYNRHFETKINFKKEYYSENLIVKWPNLSQDHMDPIINTMANIMDTLFIICGYGKIKIYSVVKNNQDYEINFELNNVNIKIIIYDTNDLEEKVTINNKVLEWPNYFETNTNIIESILKQEIDYEENYEKAFTNSIALNNIIDYMRWKDETE